ncbi:hypothetical protein FN846DRAFT_885716 [Sphaerosporella brunnea]|uniref:Uncharacterized protein n=1 Tax=Sphaerosporella brunnea TaxID=1250544 RepID=A0A5J5FC61_9PEZI|nr:hypothetical protein FN846DRAFT_885716 [Sphaerosporella brunnea]
MGKRSSFESIEVSADGTVDGRLATVSRFQNSQSGSSARRTRSTRLETPPETASKDMKTASSSTSTMATVAQGLAKPPMKRPPPEGADNVGARAHPQEEDDPVAPVWLEPLVPGLPPANKRRRQAPPAPQLYKDHPKICELLGIGGHDKDAMAEIRSTIDDYCTRIGFPLDGNYGTFPADQMMDLGAKLTKWWNKTSRRQKMTHFLMDALIHRICLDKCADLPPQDKSAAEESGDDMEDIPAHQSWKISSPVDVQVVDVQERPSSPPPPPPPEMVTTPTKSRGRSVDTEAEGLTDAGEETAGRELATDQETVGGVEEIMMDHRHGIRGAGNPSPPHSADTAAEDCAAAGMEAVRPEVATGISGSLPVTSTTLSLRPGRRPSLLREYLEWYIAIVVDDPERVDSIIRAGNILMQQDFDLMTIQRFMGSEWLLLGITLGIGLALQQDIGAYLKSRPQGGRPH